MSSDRQEGRGGTAPGDSRELEERVRRALSDAAGAIEPRPWHAGQVLGRAARRRKRRVAVWLPALGAVAAVAAVAVVAGVPRGPDEPGPVAAAPVPRPHPATASSPALVWPAVRVVAPGRAFGIGGGHRMRVTPGERCVDWDDGTGWDCRDESDKDGNQPQGTVGMQGFGYGGGTHVLLVYRGPAVPARMAVTTRGRVRPAQVVTLAVHPGWAGGYLDLPASALSHDPLDISAVTVWDAKGRVLASLAEPSARTTP
ncbi:hypothetical protein [Streptomyces sp. NPDC020983]|uniref:hypothetical protein n=1 Tax=Streptomyces sp. NPDC020983 TaxID=3365106 RepID=UPI0037AF9496